MEGYLQSSVDYLGEATACRIMRSRLGWFVKGLPRNREFREEIKHLRSQEEALNRIRSYRNRLEHLDPPTAAHRYAEPNPSRRLSSPGGP